ncbi:MULTISPECIES: hypothetical protein [Cetobacterium]|jgi:hypothetical protein|uniref:Uncharacterized protein n=1 Tax=Candidatus Cetobacterium colombiensis TaxID=3073100 RepID=A0ABU4W7L8_9FUSO|nr:hypothetical protein [Candidatus Cetobacterium colombiensis]MDX8335521.1 hypothetical protein [Candidatus Cetobacterium colombiensis]
MFLITGIIIAALFLVSTSMPFLSWVLPYYKIKKLENADLKTKIIANIVALAAIGWIDVNFLITYIGVFISIEILYYALKKYGNRLQTIDKIFTTSLIIGIGICIYMYFNRVSLHIGFEQLKSLYLQKTSFTQYEVDMAFKYIKDNFVYLIFAYMNMTVFLTYYFLNKKSFFQWNVSYLWLIPYVVFFFLEKYTTIGGAIPGIIVDIIKIVYIMYFMKIVASILNDKIKKQSICFTIGVFLALVSPEFAFIFGALASGIKIKIVKS